MGEIYGIKVQKKKKRKSKALSPVLDAQDNTTSAVVVCKGHCLLRQHRRSNYALYGRVGHVSYSVTDALPKWKCSQSGVTGPKTRDISWKIISRECSGPKRSQGGHISLMCPTALSRVRAGPWGDTRRWVSGRKSRETTQKGKGHASRTGFWERKYVRDGGLFGGGGVHREKDQAKQNKMGNRR